MALNQSYSEDFQIDDVIQYNLETLQENLKKEKVNIEIDEFEYSFMDRVENLYIGSSLLYPGEDIPNNFGVQRGYAGGGMHSSLQKTEVYKLPAARQAKAERLLELFEKTFWAILKGIDEIDEENTGEEKPDWDKLTI